MFIKTLFRNSDEAVEYGKTATKEQIHELVIRRNQLLFMLHCLDEDNTTDEELRHMMVWATYAQFCREAIEEYKRR